MPPKRTAHPAKQQALFQAGRPVHKARSSASAAVNKQSKGKKPLPPASRPSPSHEVDLVDLRTSSPVRRDDDSDSEDALDFDIPEPSSDSQVPSSPQDSVTPRRVPSHSSSPVQSIRKENFGDPIPSVKGLPDLDIDDPAFDSFWELTKRRLRYRYVKPSKLLVLKAHQRAASCIAYARSVCFCNSALTLLPFHSSCDRGESRATHAARF